jgi:superfamily I DNA/RNA helicase
MGRIDISKWRPVGVESLEDTADKAVRSGRNTLVIAGPGAGKTELLAQRACYLLQTGTCPAPKRILAISFKRDAAKNLADRVRLRSGDQARRFDSMTLDAFAKSLVDRFQKALPRQWRPKLDYEVMLQSPRGEEMREWLQGAPVPNHISRIDFSPWGDRAIKEYFDRCSHGYALPYDNDGIQSLEKWFGLRWWRQQLTVSGGRPALTFPMLNRLAALVLRMNPTLTKALRSTYHFVFLDEFQDTTSSQYDLIRVAFQDTNSVLTAVGDSKQRIMLWAGAMSAVFGFYERDFSAKREHLVRNYRSAPELVTMQHSIAKSIEAGTPMAVASKCDEEKGVCAVLEFANPEKEALTLAELISKDISEKGLHPRDFCVLVRQLTSQMILYLKEALTEKGLRIRDESLLQDLLTEPVVVILLSILRLATRRRDAEAWNMLTMEVAALNGWDLDEGNNRVQKEAKRLINFAQRSFIGILSPDGAYLTASVNSIYGEIGEEKLRSTYRQYARGSYLSSKVKELGEALAQAMGKVCDVRSAVDEVIGIDIIPAMTIHKSKGLEFHSIVFLGLEDSSWWSFASQPEEEKRSFFVAFSRAKNRVIFTFSDQRDGKWGRRRQQKNEIEDLYTILQHAGVPSQDLRCTQYCEL